jgi:hypothetical protein
VESRYSFSVIERMLDSLVVSGRVVTKVGGSSQSVQVKSKMGSSGGTETAVSWGAAGFGASAMVVFNENATCRRYGETDDGQNEFLNTSTVECVIWLTCCALHNMLLDVDGLSKAWKSGAKSHWELESGEFCDDEIPFAVRRLVDPTGTENFRLRQYDGSRFGYIRPTVVSDNEDEDEDEDDSDDERNETGNRNCNRIRDQRTAGPIGLERIESQPLLPAGAIWFSSLQLPCHIPSAFQRDTI